MSSTWYCYNLYKLFGSRNSHPVTNKIFIQAIDYSEEDIPECISDKHIHFLSGKRRMLALHREFADLYPSAGVRDGVEYYLDSDLMDSMYVHGGIRFDNKDDEMMYKLSHLTEDVIIVEQE